MSTSTNHSLASNAALLKSKASKYAYYGVVDSVLLNCPELKAVQVLFGGREIETLTGHLDLSKPLAVAAFVASHLICLLFISISDRSSKK